MVRFSIILNNPSDNVNKTGCVLVKNLFVRKINVTVNLAFLGGFTYVASLRYYY